MGSKIKESEGKIFVALMLFVMKDSWFQLTKAKRRALTREHVGTLSKFSNKVWITHLSGTGLSKYDLIEILESDDIMAIEGMIGAFKTGAKARHGDLRDIVLMEKGIDQLL